MSVNRVLKWSACMMVRNEEEMVADTVPCIRNQTMPPNHIHVLNDSSTDSTGQILDGMDDVIVTCIPPHPSQHSDLPHIARRHELIREAAKRGIWHYQCRTSVPHALLHR